MGPAATGFRVLFHAKLAVQVMGKDAYNYKLFASEGEPCLFKPLRLREARGHAKTLGGPIRRAKTGLEEAHSSLRNVSPRDIEQGYLGDCHLPSPALGMA